MQNFIHYGVSDFNMALLDLLFPSINNLKNGAKESIPSWIGMEDTPWEIFSKNNKNNLNNQLIEFLKIQKGGKENLINSIIDTKYGEVYIHPSAKIGEFVKIEGPCYIGKNSEIRHSAYLRKGSWICENTVVGHSSEIKNSILLPGAKAPHFNYVGDSVIGFDSNLGSGVKISNVRHDKRTVLVELKNGIKIDTKIKKFGALVGDRCGIGCNSVTNPGTILKQNIFIPPNETLSGWND